MQQVFRWDLENEMGPQWGEAAKDLLLVVLIIDMDRPPVIEYQPDGASRYRLGEHKELV